MPHFTTGQVVTAAILNASIHELLAEATASGSSNVLSIASIPQTHRDLQVVVHGSTNGTQLRGVTVRFNSDSGSNYRYVRVETLDNGTPTRTSSQSATGLAIGAFGDDAFLSMFRLDVPDYAASRNNAAIWQSAGTEGTLGGQSQIVTGSGQWVSASAITSIDAVVAVDNWSANSTLKLYGFGLL